MTKEQLKVGKLYRNNASKYLYDKVVCVTDMNIKSTRVYDTYIEYYWVQAPNKICYGTISILQDWEPIDE